MIIKESIGPNIFLNRLLEILRNYRIGIGISALVLYSGLMFIFGAKAYKSGFVSDVRELISSKSYRIVHNYVKGLTTRPQRITIDIKYKNVEKLRRKREVALSKGTLINSSEDYVPASIRYGDETIKVKLRLKGDQLDHLRGDKWSFRIRVKDDNTLMGMKQLSIQHPGTRNYIYEWIFHQVARREGLISLRYKFVNVTVNGKDLGLYALEEHFEKRLIENNRRREGPIIRFDESLWWVERLHFEESRSLPGLGNYYSLPIDMFHTKRTFNDPVLFKNYLAAQNLLEQFRRDKLPASQVFEIERLAKNLALCDLFGAIHSIHTNQLRFYYDPILSLLEPIPFDINGGYKLNRLACMYTNEYDSIYQGGGRTIFLTTLFKDCLFWENYVRELEKFSTPSYLDTLFEELNDGLSQSLNEIYSEFPHYSFSKDVLYQNQEYIRTFLNPAKGLHAYYHKGYKDRIEIELGNIQQIPVEVLNASYKDSIVFENESKIIIFPKAYSDPINYQNIGFILPDGFAWSDTMVQDLKINYRLLGTSRLRYETVFPWSHLDENFLSNDFIRQQPNLSDFDFLVVDEKDKSIIFKSGEWNLTRNLIIPGDYRVIAGGGLKLNLKNSSKILSYSPVNFIGSEGNPIVIYSSDSSGQGIAVMNSQRQSLLKYVNFDNLSNLSHNGWELTGAITFHKSPVKISCCQFTRIRSEDALNIISSEFEIDNTVFDENLSDAFDADFAKGSVINSSFINCGNDAIDASGSVISVNGNFINGAGDKGLSVGENSEMVANKVEVRKAEIAVASKDMSEIKIEGIEIYDSKIGFTAFQKKPEFGPASIEVSELEMDKVDVPYLIEAGSDLTVNGKRIKPSRENVKDILYGVEYGKASN